jgi:hypothetical protein
LSRTRLQQLGIGNNYNFIILRFLRESDYQIRAYARRFTGSKCDTKTAGHKYQCLKKSGEK